MVVELASIKAWSVADRKPMLIVRGSCWRTRGGRSMGIRRIIKGQCTRSINGRGEIRVREQQAAIRSCIDTRTSNVINWKTLENEISFYLHKKSFFLIYNSLYKQKLHNLLHEIFSSLQNYDYFFPRNNKSKFIYLFI